MSCSLCTDPSYTADAHFTTAAQGGVGAYFHLSCAELATQNVPAPSTPPNTIAFSTELGRWCAFQEALNSHDCQNAAAPFPPTCGPGLCAATQTVCPPPGNCPKCADVALTGDPTFADTAQNATAAFFTMTCQDLYASAVPEPTSTVDTTPWKSEMARWCAYQEALNHQGCSGGGGLPAPACPAAMCAAAPNLCP
jgi:hypothetical protein